MIWFACNAAARRTAVGHVQPWKRSSMTAFLICDDSAVGTDEEITGCILAYSFSNLHGRVSNLWLFEFRIWI